MEFDLHGHHPDDVLSDGRFERLVQQVWEMGEPHLRLIHGHGRGRGISPGFVNTNTGYFGLRIRDALRHDHQLRAWIKYTTLDCTEQGVTGVRLKRNPNPTRTALDKDVLGDPRHAGGRRYR